MQHSKTSTKISKRESHQLLIDGDGEIRELTLADMRRMKPAREVLPELVDLYLKSRGRPKKAQTAKAVSIRLDPDVEAFFRDTGNGWQTRINNVLRDAITLQKHLTA